MYKKKALVSGLLVCSLALVACGNGGSEGGKAKSKADASIEVNKEGFPITKDKLSMGMIAPGTGLAEWSDMPMLKEYAKMTNIDFKYTTPPLSDFSTKLNLAFASGDLPDIIFGAGSTNLTRAMEVDYGGQGILVPLEDLIPEYAPNLNKVLEENPEIKKSITSVDGHIYSLPTIGMGDTSIWPRGPLWYNGDWLKALDVKELPKSVDEFYDLLVRFRDEDPNGNGKKDEIPLTDVEMNSSRDWLLSAFGLTTQGIEEIDGKVQFNPTTENYKAYLTFMNKLYKEKLLDPEVYSQADEQKKAKGNNNQLGLFPDWFSYFTTGKNEEESLTDPMFGPLTSEYSKDPVVPGSPRLTTGVFAVTNNAKSPEAALRWVDYFYTEEGLTFLNQGPEGALWEYAENDKGEKVRVYAKGIDLDKTEDERGKITVDYGIPVPAKQVSIPGIKRDANDPDTFPFEEFIKKETQDKIEPYAKVPFPIVYLTKEEQDQIGDMATDLTTYVEQMEAKFITGVESLDNWDNFIKTIESMGVKDYVKVYQQAYDRWSDA